MADSLPYDAEIEYLRSTGTQYIDVGFKGDMDLDYVVTARTTDANSFYNVLGDRLSSSSRRYTLMVAPSSASSGGYFNCGNPNQITFPKTITPTIYNVYTKESNNVYINSALIGTFSQQTFTTPDNIILFGARENGALNNMLHGDISACQFSNNGVLLRDFIPVRVGQVGYMYDKVSKQLFGNAGSGSFILGNDI